MARVPAPGRCKTRLSAAIGAERAADLYAAMLADRISAIDAAPTRRRALVVAPEDGGASRIRGMVPEGWAILEQRGADLGARVANAFDDLHDGGVTCLVDSDSPALPIARALALLEAAPTARDIVIGPSEDGGYYLIAMSVREPRIFRGVPWSTAAVLETTRRNCEELGYNVIELFPGWDVDEPRDLERLAAELDSLDARAPRTAALMRELCRLDAAKGTWLSGRS